MITDENLNVVQNVINTTPESEWIDAAKIALPDVDEADIVEMVMFLNVNDVVDLAG